MMNNDNKNLRQPSARKKTADVLTFVFGVLIFFFGMHWITNYFDITPIPHQVQLPPVEIPPEKENDYLQVELLQSPFIPPLNPFSETEYGLAPRIILGGEFEEAILSVQGEVTTDDSVFLLLNFNKTTGVIKGVRSKDNLLDVSKTLEKGGLFTKTAPISVEVNLMSDVIGASSTDLKDYPTGEKPVKLIIGNQLPEVYKVLVLPFTRSGKYEGARLDSISIRYRCVDGDTSKCSIDLCQYPKSTQCITEKFGPEETSKWRKRNGI